MDHRAGPRVTRLWRRGKRSGRTLFPAAAGAWGEALALEHGDRKHPRPAAAEADAAQARAAGRPGNLSHQIAHHLFPGLPSHRYPRMAVEVREICERHGLPYTTGSLSRQLGSVARKIFRLALPAKRPAPR
jgi:fatty acid desaturase